MGIVCAGYLANGASGPMWTVYGPLGLGIALLTLGCIPWKPAAWQVTEAEKKIDDINKKTQAKKAELDKLNKQ